VPKASSKSTKSKRARAVAIEEPAERGLLMRMVLHSPKDMVGGLIAFSAVSAIIANAIFLQKGHHPSPMFGSSTVVAFPAPTPTANPLPKPRPSDVTLTAADTRLDSRVIDARPINPASEPKPSVVAKPADKLADPRGGDPMANLVKATAAPSTTTSSVQRPPASIPHAGKTDPLGDLITNTRRVAAVQRALTEYGYGQLKPTGNVGSDTSAAIQRFERERKLPVTGQMSTRLVQELGSVTGRAIN
jgi:hypothetical protein